MENILLVLFLPPGIPLVVPLVTQVFDDWACTALGPVLTVYDMV